MGPSEVPILSPIFWTVGSANRSIGLSFQEVFPFVRMLQSKYDIARIVGEGSFGKALLCNRKADGKVRPQVYSLCMKYFYHSIALRNA